MFYFILLILLSFCAYLLGSVNFAILLCSIYGYQDPRLSGSHNPGATNVLRVANKYIAVLVLFFDGFKGWLPVFVANFVLDSDLQIAFVGLFAFLGHLYPVFFNFQGGKGVATFIGVLVALDYQLALVFIIIWLIVALISKYSSLGAIVASIAVPVYLCVLLKSDILLPIIIMVMLLLLRHKDNIKRLCSGAESKIKFLT